MESSSTSSSSSSSSSSPNKNSNSNSNSNPRRQKKKTSAVKKRTAKTNVVATMPKIELLQLRNLHEVDTVEDHYESVARRTELTKLKWIQTLRQRLEEAANSKKNASKPTPTPTPPQKKTSSSSSSSSSLLWDVTQTFMSRKSIPVHVQNTFWNLIVAPTDLSETNFKRKRQKSMPPTDISKDELAILTTFREQAVQMPLFWNHTQKHGLSRSLKQPPLPPPPPELFSPSPTTTTTTITTTTTTTTTTTMDDYQMERSKILQRLHLESKTEEERTAEVRVLAEKLRNRLPPRYYKKLIKGIADRRVDQTQAQTQTQAIRMTSSSSDDDDDSSSSSSSDISSSNISSSDINSNKSRIRTMQLYSSLHASVKSHIHLIARDLAEFLYLDLSAMGSSASASTSTNSSLSIGSSSSEQSSSITPDSSHEKLKLKLDVIADDSRVQGYEEAWEARRSQFVLNFLAIQAMLIDEHEQKTKRFANDETEEEEGEEDDNDDNDGITAEIEDIVEEEDSYDDSEESVMATFHEAGKAPAGQKIEAKKIPKPRVYTVFEAISVGEKATSLDGKASLAAPVQESLLKDTSFPSTAPVERLVFLDNLPIDISENRLMEAYSRCGPIEEIKIFQRRSDLDPGRKSDDSKKKIRKPSNAKQKWQRPRTPLYAMILYRDEAGASKATVDSLCIFGMVLDMHLIRSYRATDMTKLYLEDIPTNHDVTSVEYSLSQILHPDLYVCLDVGRRQRKVQGPSSCEIKFPNFESTYWAYLKLSSELEFLNEEGSECDLHWRQTPRDAILYWTRQLNF